MNMGKTGKKETRGRRTLYKAEMCDLVERLCSARDSRTKNLPIPLKVTRQTLDTWKRVHPEFLRPYKMGERMRTGNVARALYFRATGAVVHKQQPFKVKKVYYDNQNRRCEEERVVIAEFDDQVPPDTAAAFIWLKNRRSGQVERTSLCRKATSPTRTCSRKSQGKQPAVGF